MRLFIDNIRGDNSLLFFMVRYVSTNVPAQKNFSYHVRIRKKFYHSTGVLMYRTTAAHILRIVTESHRWERDPL